MLYIHGLGHFHPENVITNQFLEDLDIGTTRTWIVERVGIQSRRTVLELDYIRATKNADPRAAQEASTFTNAETGSFAAQMALKNANIDASQVGMVIAGGCSADLSTPAEACIIASRLGINSPAFDLNSACSSFGAQLYFLSLMQTEALPEFILLISPENNTRTVNYQDRRTAVLWGDGTSAALVSTRVPSQARVLFNTLQSEPAGWDKVYIPRSGHFVQDGAAVQAFAVKRTSQCLKEIRNRLAKSLQNFNFIGHQANYRMLQSVCEKCAITPERHFYNIIDFGNTGAAGAPTVLSQNWHRFGAGAVLALVVVGAGLTWSSMVIEFDAMQKAA